MNDLQFIKFKKQLKYAAENSPLYKMKLKGINTEDIKTPDDISKLPFTQKEELRDMYPLGIQAASDENIVRVHSSSGTTGQPIIIPYTANDIYNWGLMFKRCYEFAGLTKLDRIQITPGYGLWTAGIGFQAGAEMLGAMVIPMGPGNTDKQLKMMVDLKSTVLASTSSYALVIAEQVHQRGLTDKIHLSKGIIGSERWGDKMRSRIAEELGIELFDIYGLTEIYGPGISIDCPCHTGLHYWNDFVYFEIINAATGEILPDGESGELVITTLCKEGAPLIRYRTHDITRLIPGVCPCGSVYPRHDRIVGRTDDMVKVKGVNIYPGQIEDLLKDINGISSEYLVEIKHIDSKDELLLSFECVSGANQRELESTVFSAFKSKIGIKIIPQAVDMGNLPRSEKKTKRVIDNR